MNTKKVLVAMSGGVDSGVAAARLCRAGYEVAGVHMHLWSEEVQRCPPIVRAGKGTKVQSNNELHSGKAAKRQSKREFHSVKASELQSSENKEQSKSTMKLWNSETMQLSSFANKCCDLESEVAARRTAAKLGTPFYLVHFEDIFKETVVDYFLEEYGLGRTPNPCIRCNKFIKFGALYEYARKTGFDYLATGHYARISAQYQVSSIPPKGRAGKNQNDRGKFKTYRLLSGVDEKKDQSYFLYSLTQEQLAHVLFPLGDLTKREVRGLAEKWDLPVAARPESQEVCFYSESDYRPFLERQIPDRIKPGEVVDTRERVIGQHKGLPLYTIGQRHGFELSSKPRTQKLKNSKLQKIDSQIHTRGSGGTSDRGVRMHSPGVRESDPIPPFYVVAKDTKRNRLVVGFGPETEIREFTVNKVNWVLPELQSCKVARQRGGQAELQSKGGKELNPKPYTLNAYVRIRHQGALLKAKIQINKVPSLRQGFGRQAKIPRSKKGKTLQETAGGGRGDPKGLPWSGKRVKVTFDEPQRGVAPGQGAVFYRKLQSCRVAESQRNEKWQSCKVSGFQSRKDGGQERSTVKLCGSEALELVGWEVLGGGTIGEISNF